MKENGITPDSYLDLCNIYAFYLYTSHFSDVELWKPLKLEVKLKNINRFAGKNVVTIVLLSYCLLLITGADVYLAICNMLQIFDWEITNEVF